MDLWGWWAFYGHPWGTVALWGWWSSMGHVVMGGDHHGLMGLVVFLGSLRPYGIGSPLWGT